jgi:hypothetical protein
MDKKAVYHIIGWIVALAACGYLVYRLAIYDDYPSLWASLVGMGWQQYMALALCVLLMPVNMSIEAWKLKTLIPMTWYEAHREVYYSKLAGLVTPWRLGEYPSRALLRGEWKQTLSMGAVGSATMTIAIIAAGLTAMILEIGDWRLEIGYYLLVGAVLLLLILALIFSPLLLRRWATVSHRLILVSVGQSFIRLACWCVQLYLVLFALGGLGDLGILGNLGKTAIYYLLVTITPNVPIAEVGVRGSWAIVLFGSMNAALAGVLLWGINTLLPCLISLFFAKNNKTIA